MSQRATPEAWRDLPLIVETKAVERLARRATGGALRNTAIVRLGADGLEGFGEEVTFQDRDLLAPMRAQPCAFVGTLGEFCEWLPRVDLFRHEPHHAVVRRYRRWAHEAAALDLALRQADATLSDLLGLQAHPVRFVVSPPAGFTKEPEGVRLKIEASDLRPGLPVDIVDFKDRGDHAAVSYALDLYPDAFLEDPPVVVPAAQISWDTAVHSADDIERLSDRPAAINVKPARIGSIAELLAVYRLCAREGITVYGGGQHELGPGRLQIQQLAALFSPHQPNDVAPSVYNNAHKPRRLPPSPLSVGSKKGFG